MPLQFCLPFELLKNRIETEFDEEGTLFLCKVLANKLKLNDGNWVKIFLEKDVTKVRYVKISLIDFEIESSKALISPLLWFNLRLQDPLTCSPVDPIPQVLIVQSSEEPLISDQIQFALVKCPQYSNFDLHHDLLEDYLCKERVLKESDIIGIPITSSSLDTFNESACNKTNFDNLVVFYKVIQIENNGHLVNSSSKWGVYSSISCNISLRASDYLLNAPNNFLLDKYVDSLSNFILPYLGQLRYQVGTILISGPRSCGKKTLSKKVASLWNLCFYHIGYSDYVGDVSSATFRNLKYFLEKVINYKRCMLFLDNIDHLLLEKDNFSLESIINETISNFTKHLSDNECIILIASTSKPKLVLTSEIGHIFKHHLYIESPDEEQREKYLKNIFIHNDATLFRKMASASYGFNFNDLDLLISKTQRIMIKKGLDPSKDDFNYTTVLKEIHKKFSKALGSIRIPNVDWNDIGGLRTVKKEIMDIFEAQSKYPEIVASGFRRCGIILYGPPGTGKTLLAKAIASQCALNFLSVKGPELMSIYVGETEANVRDIFSKAINSSPSVIFFDELDSMAPKRGKFGSGEVMDRVVSQLITEIDLISKYEDVFIIGATNRPDLLEPSLLIPGRFERLVYVGPPEDQESRISILTALTRKFYLKNVDLCDVEALCPPMLTGADFYSICSSSMMNALNRTVERIDNGEIDEEDAYIEITFPDFRKALENFVPSVTEQELNHYEKVRALIES